MNPSLQDLIGKEIESIDYDRNIDPWEIVITFKGLHTLTIGLEYGDKDFAILGVRCCINKSIEDIK